MTQTEVLKLALEALEDNQHLVADNERHAYVMEYNDLIEKCKEVLAQQSNISELKEKTANHNVDCLCADCSMLDDLEDATAQPEQDKERCVGCEACIDTACGRDECPKGWPKAPQPEQELDYKAIGQQAYESGYSTGYMDCAVKMKAQPEQDEYLSKAYRLANELRCHLAIAPAPQRTWVGLDLDERAACYEASGGNLSKFAAQIEAKLRSKNGY